jgi:phosphatidylglycerophosphate synthase
MSSRAGHLVIDARPRGPRGLLAAEVVLGRSVLYHLLELATQVAISDEPVIVHAREDEHRELRALLGRGQERSVLIVSHPPRADAAVLRTDRYYDAMRLRRALHQGRSPETAVLWRLDSTESLLAANEELKRRISYQPVGKYWAFPLARRLAEWLRPTRVRPNALTLTAAGLMLLAAGLVALGPVGWIGRASVVLALGLALVLDTADGRLARLQGTSSAFGRWLDQVLDEFADVALHSAIAWAAYSATGSSIWLLLATLYASGKYLFLVQSLLGDELEGHEGQRTAAPRWSLTQRPIGNGQGQGHGHGRAHGSIGRLTWFIGMVGHADIRWNLWILLAALGRLDIALAIYACYFPTRALAGAVRKAVRYA